MDWKKVLLSFAVIFSLILGIHTESALSQSAVYSVTVNYDLSLTEMIKAGQYDWVNSDLTEKRFPVNGTATKEISTEIVCFNQYMGSNDVFRELDKRGLRPATIEELLAFGAKYPEIQRSFPIVALGSVWQTRYYRSASYLWGSSNGRNLGLGWLEEGWGSGFRFLAVRK